MTIEDAVKELKGGDLVRIRWNPFIRLYGKDTFTAEFLSNNKEKREILVARTVFDLFDIQITPCARIPYARIESLEKLEPKKLY